jgi:hypothetical protein
MTKSASGGVGWGTAPKHEMARKWRTSVPSASTSAENGSRDCAYTGQFEDRQKDARRTLKRGASHDRASGRAVWAAKISLTMDRTARTALAESPAGGG